MPIKADTMTFSLEKIHKNLTTGLADAAFKEFRRVTPVRTGNARRKTRLQGKKIIAGYKYATILDSGSSKQAPNGMSKPTTKFLNELMKKKIRK